MSSKNVNWRENDGDNEMRGYDFSHNIDGAIDVENAVTAYDPKGKERHRYFCAREIGSLAIGTFLGGRVLPFAIMISSHKLR